MGFGYTGFISPSTTHSASKRARRNRIGTVRRFRLRMFGVTKADRNCASFARNRRRGVDGFESFANLPAFRLLRPARQLLHTQYHARPSIGLFYTVFINPSNDPLVTCSIKM